MAGEIVVLHHDAEEARRRGTDGLEFFRYAINALVANDTVPGQTRLWEEYLELKGGDLPTVPSPAIGTPADYAEMLRSMQGSGIDQVILLQQGGRNRHDHIRESLELFGAEVLPEFVDGRGERDAAKPEELAPFIAALERKSYLEPLAAEDGPVVKASRERETLYHED